VDGRHIRGRAHDVPGKEMTSSSTSRAATLAESLSILKRHPLSRAELRELDDAIAILTRSEMGTVNAAPQSSGVTNTERPGEATQPAVAAPLTPWR
jgi:hypothetical protein